MNISIQFTGWLEFKIIDVQQYSGVEESIDNVLAQQWIPKNSISLSNNQLDANNNITTILIPINTSDDSVFSGLSVSIVNALISNKHISSQDQIIETSVIGPSIGAYMRSSALYAIWFGMLLMAIYILFAFASLRTSLSPAVLAIIVLVTMIFDISIPSGAYGLLMAMDPTIQLDSIFIVALLTTMWYSINDTIIIFDRIRENIVSASKQWLKTIKQYEQIFEDSLWQTMRRSLATSVSTFLVVFAMYVFGSGVIQLFAFTMGIGLIAGSFSSIFIAAPLAYLIIKQSIKKSSR